MGDSSPDGYDNYSCKSCDKPDDTGVVMGAAVREEPPTDIHHGVAQSRGKYTLVRVVIDPDEFARRGTFAISLLSSTQVFSCVTS